MGDRSEKQKLHWVSLEGGIVLSDYVRVADNYFKRLVGLQFARGMTEGEALWLKNCRSVHTAWMRFAIDICFLDEEFCVIDVHRKVRPWRIVRCREPGAQHVIESQCLLHPEQLKTGLRTAMDPVFED